MLVKIIRERYGTLIFISVIVITLSNASVSCEQCVEECGELRGGAGLMEYLWCYARLATFLYSFKKKHPWRSFILESVTLLKVTLLYWCFPRFSNFTNGTKSRSVSHLDFLERKFRPSC